MGDGDRSGPMPHGTRILIDSTNMDKRVQCIYPWRSELKAKLPTPDKISVSADSTLVLEVCVSISYKST